MQSGRVDPTSTEELEAFISLPQGEADDFWTQLFTGWRETVGFGCKSILNRDIDLYGDLIERHLSLKIPALTWFDRGERVAVSYSQIAQEVDALAALWLSNPIEKGDSVCILCTHPYHRIVAILCAFRLGLVPFVFDPTGPVAVQALLEDFPSTHIHAEPGVKDWVPETLRASILGLDKKSSLSGLGAHRQAAKAVILRLLDPFCGNSPSVIELTAQDLFLRLLRDGHSILNLRRGSRLASTVTLKDSTSPLIELMTFICGASLTYLDDQMPARHLTHLLTEPFDLVGVSRSLIGVLLEANQNNPRSGEWKRWYRSPLESQHIIEWQDFAEQLSLQQTPHADFHWATPCAGIAFGSEWSTDLFAFDLYPAPGQTWFLGEMASPETPTKGLTGRLVITSEIEEETCESPTPFILASNEKAYRFLGCYPSGRSGLAFPEDLVYRCLEAPLFWHTVIELPTLNGSQFVLLAFMDTRTKGEIHKKIEQDIGLFAQPDQIEIVPFVPKLNQKGNIDSEWAKRLYMSGEFTRRSKIPVYSSLTNVKMLLLNQTQLPA